MPNFKGVLALVIFAFPLAPLAQLISSLPSCIVDCIEQSPDTNCAINNIGCLCRASAGNFLTDTVICMRGTCDNALDADLLLTPLQLACNLAGAPIPDSAIRNAEAVPASSVAPVTKTVTMGSSPSSGMATNTGVTTLTTTQGGSTIAIAYSVTEWRTTTISGPGSTITSISTASLSYIPIPIILQTTDSDGSTYTTTTTERGAATTVTTTNSQGYTTTQRLTIIQTTTRSANSASSATGNGDTTFVTTTIAGQATSSSASSTSATRSSLPDNDSTDSAPFKVTNAGEKKRVGTLLWISVLVVATILWF